MTAAAQVWGMSEVEFLLLYGTAVVAFVVISYVILSAGPDQAGEAHTDLDVHELAMLRHGPQLAITVAAASLHRDGLLHAGSGGALTAAGELPANAHVLQRAVFDAVAQKPRISGRELRRQVGGTDPLRRMDDALLQRGLRLQGVALGIAHALWWLGALLWLAALVRVWAVLAGDVEGEVSVATWVLIPALVIAFNQGLAHRPRRRQSPRGRSLVRQLRDTGAVLRESPRNDAPMAAALFGAAILWAAEPDLAQALGVSQTAWSEWDWDWDWVGDGDCGGCGGCGG